MIKIGNYYVKKSALAQLRDTNKNSQNETHASDARLLAKLKEDQEMEEYDQLVKNNPQFLTEYVKDIFLNLKKNEVN